MDNPDKLNKNSISLFGLAFITIAGVLPIIAPIEVAAFISNAQGAAIWPVILGYLLFLAVSLPILEYTRIAPFTGGYYGLAEIGFGKAVGKFTALCNYLFYNAWQMANAFFIGWLIVDTLYILYGILLPYYGWIILLVFTLLATFLITIQHPKNLSKILSISILFTLIIVVISAVYVISRSPFNSTYYLTPSSSPSGFTGIALATAIVGFYTFTGYASPLFYSEETVESRKNVWKAIYLGLTISAIVIALVTYSEVASVPLSNLSSVGSSSMPQLVSWIRYIPSIVLLIINIIIGAVSLIAFGGGSGAQARLLWSMSRDNFIKNSWINKLDNNRVPRNAALLNLVLAIIIVLVASSLMIYFYGYNANTVELSFYVAGTLSTILWYFHHFIPEMGLYAFLRKHKEFKFSKLRKIISGLVVPIAGIAFFIYTFYEGIIGDFVQPYLTAVVIGAILILFSIIYTLYKRNKGELGESVVLYNISENKGDIIDSIKAEK
ncbi:APC family permease [Acidianus manzaensis]|uniref:Cationic amino acid permease n=1 Tax=Acidianus manzaensis TaxID=282676 RepID=A0A1W6JZ36_9CREN|nr:APC family permease [Acidianus manzaensis]ARM75464.1 cationic amino acid permease [Acidianus manzaensis]